MQRRSAPGPSKSPPGPSADRHCGHRQSRVAPRAERDEAGVVPPRAVDQRFDDPRGGRAERVGSGGHSAGIARVQMRRSRAPAAATRAAVRKRSLPPRLHRCARRHADHAQARRPRRNRRSATPAMARKADSSASGRRSDARATVAVAVPHDRAISSRCDRAREHDRRAAVRAVTAVADEGQAGLSPVLPLPRRLIGHHDHVGAQRPTCDRRRRQRVLKLRPATTGRMSSALPSAIASVGIDQSDFAHPLAPGQLVRERAADRAGADDAQRTTSGEDCILIP